MSASRGPNGICFISQTTPDRATSQHRSRAWSGGLPRRGLSVGFNTARFSSMNCWRPRDEKRLLSPATANSLDLRSLIVDELDMCPSRGPAPSCCFEVFSQSYEAVQPLSLQTCPARVDDQILVADRPAYEQKAAKASSRLKTGVLNPKKLTMIEERPDVAPIA